MTEKKRSGRDAFALSLGGLRTITPFGVAPVVPHDRINKAIGERLRKPVEDQPEEPGKIGTRWGRYWLRALRRAA